MKNDEIERLCNTLLQGNIYNNALTVTLDDFQKIYNMFIQFNKTNPVVSLVNLETVVVGQFSDISPQHFDIQHEIPLTEIDFEFIMRKKWYGSKEIPLHFIKFLKVDLLQNWKKLMPIFIISTLLLFITNNNTLNELILTFIVQSATVFLSLYIIFTVTQSQALFKDISLFKSGILQQYYNDDKNITMLGIITIALAFFNTAMIFIFAEFGKSINWVWYPLVSRILKTMFVAIGITLLFHTFFTVADYYLERSRDVLERDMVSDLLNIDYQHFQKNKRN